MSDWISTNQVNSYLLRIKAAIAKGKYKFLDSRRKNIDSLAMVGLLPHHAKEFILALTYHNYFNGPEPEESNGYPPGECMFFGCTVQSLEFYVKIKLCKEENSDYCYCLSFHIAENKIVYPYHRK